jgi:hypothetical protein
VHQEEHHEVNQPGRLCPLLKMRRCFDICGRKVARDYQGSSNEGQDATASHSLALISGTCLRSGSNVLGF